MLTEDVDTTMFSSDGRQSDMVIDASSNPSFDHNEL
jgi:hypothetical protein